MWPITAFSFFLPIISALPFDGAPNHVAREVIAKGTKLRILPLGASITYGCDGTPGCKGGSNGYREELGKRLQGSEYLFTGTQTSGTMKLNHNEGHPGYTILAVQNVMGKAIDEKPNVVLLHLGTNDMNNPENPKELYKEAPERLLNLTEKIHEKLPDTFIVISKLIHNKKKATDDRIKTFNDKLEAEVVKPALAKKIKIKLADMSVIQADQTVDGTHPNKKAYDRMGDIFFETLKEAASKNLISKPIGPDPDWAKGLFDQPNNNNDNNNKNHQENSPPTPNPTEDCDGQE